MVDFTSFVPLKPLNTAVLFLVFNRLEKTKLVFESIRKAKPPRLYVASDGARLQVKGEFEKVMSVRSFIQENVDWPCKVEFLFRNENFGCKYAVSEAINWFFRNESKGIILEDDCLPSHSFFWYCEELLDKYENDSRIWHIDGSNFIGNTVPFDASYDFSCYPLIWGWASWSRAWKFYDFELNDFDFLNKNKYFNFFLESFIAGEYWKERFIEVKYKNLDTWDYQWIYTIWKNSGLTICPSVNMIKNIGFDLEATHTKNSNNLFDNMCNEDISFPLKSPKSISRNFLRDAVLSKIRFGITFPRYLKNLVLRKIIYFEK